ncbi:hypothetical protein [Streptomyces sp. SYSU K217416]
MVSTCRHHGFESLEEQRLLLVLDFLRAAEVLPQPFRLGFEHAAGRAEHTPGAANTALGGTLEAAFCGKKTAPAASSKAPRTLSTLPAEADLPERR